jgi:hypothetical protein
MFRLSLEVRRGSKRVRHKLSLSERGKVLIGRKDCGLKIMDPAVSRQHLALAVKHGKLLAGDLKSKHGTKLNGRDLHRAHLKKGDVLQVGHHVIEIRAFGPDRPWARRLAPAGVVLGALLLALSVLSTPPKADPFGPAQASAGWSEVRRWARTVRPIETSVDKPIDYERIFAD